MTVGDPGRELRTLEHDEVAEAPPPTFAARRHTDEPGLGSLHATLDRLIITLHLRSLTVVIDDPDLGRQAFRAGSGPFEPGTLSGRPGVRADPELPPDRVDPELLVQLCATSLRLELERAERPDARGVDVAEIALRRLPGVHAVVVERDGDLMVVQVHADADAPSDLARAAAHATAPLAETRLVVEVVRDIAEQPVPEPPLVAPDPATPAAEALPIPPRGPARAPRATDPTVVAVRNDPENGEVEVHVRRDEVRTIGRAPMAQGLAGAVTATLEALSSVGFEHQLTLGWARTIETTADRRFVVAVSLMHAGTRESSHGLGSGASPIEAAARATLDAASREDDST
ncbi:MAG: hypothetical protein FJW86_02820 [Actinobacteria bacterium]|nr:hypothetical protein [Actinomycetota bacterium]